MFSSNHVISPLLIGQLLMRSRASNHIHVELKDSTGTLWNQCVHDYMFTTLVYLCTLNIGMLMYT